MKNCSWILLFLLTSSACGSEDVASVNASVAMGLSSSLTPPANAAAVGQDQSGSVFTVESARAHVRDIELDLPDGLRCSDLVDFVPEPPVSCDSSDSDDSPGDDPSDHDTIRIAGPFVFDLVAQTSTPSLEGLTLPSVAFQRVDVRFDDAEPDEGVIASGDPLAGETLRALGTFDHAGNTTDYELILGFNEDARFERPDGVEVVDATTLLLQLDVDAWFQALPISECIEDGDLTVSNGVLVLTDGSGSCSDIENALKDAIKSSGQLDRKN